MEAVQTNNKQICQEIKETLLKELDYQFRLQEEKEDAREEERLQKQEEHEKEEDKDKYQKQKVIIKGFLRKKRSIV